MLAVELESRGRAEAQSVLKFRRRGNRGEQIKCRGLCLQSGAESSLEFLTLSPE